MSLHFGLWAKICIIILCVLAINIIVVLFTSESFFWIGGSKKILFSNMLFIEGAFILGIGALIASGYTAARVDRWPTMYASPEGHADYIREQRRKQIGFGILLMIIGGLLIVLSVVVYSVI
jgi:hypothetical protein